MIFFYEILFTIVAVGAWIMGEVWSRTAALIFLAAWLAIITLGYASFGARLAQADGLNEEEREWYLNARDGLRHLRLLFVIATVLALVWRVIAG
jgi:hypothetical protein